MAQFLFSAFRWLVFFTAFVWAEPLIAGELVAANILQVTDGDTVKLVVGGEVIKVRLLDIDCFENKRNRRAKWQAEMYQLSEHEVLQRGRMSASILKTLLAENMGNIYVSFRGRDYYRRKLGTLYVSWQGEKMNVNRYMLDFGGCVVYQPQPRKWKPKW